MIINDFLILTAMVIYPLQNKCMFVDATPIKRRKKTGSQRKSRREGKRDTQREERMRRREGELKHLLRVK